MVINEQNQPSPPCRGELKPGRDFLGIERACLGMMASAGGSAGIVKQQRQVKDKGILELLEQCLVLAQFGVLGIDKGIQLFDTDERVFIRRITMDVSC